MRTLSELGVQKDKMIFALNKADLVSNDEIDEKIDVLNLTENKKWITVSAKSGKNVKDLKQLISNIIESQDGYKIKKNFGKEIGN